MVNIKETAYVWIAIVGIAAGCAFSYGCSSIIFEDLQESAYFQVEDNVGQTAVAIGSVRTAARIEARTSQIILAEIASAEAQIEATKQRIVNLQDELAKLKPTTTEVQDGVNGHAANVGSVAANRAVDQMPTSSTASGTVQKASRSLK